MPALIIVRIYPPKHKISYKARPASLRHHLLASKLNMSSNTFKVIAKAGGGGFVGVEIVKALLKLGGFEVRILIRALDAM